MRASEDVSYRLALARGFLDEAEQDWQLKRWRSCVDNAQLAAENAGKAVLAAFGITPKTHDPVNQIASLLATRTAPPAMAAIMQDTESVAPASLC
ncbi:MAG: HEPN domain-containing protein [Caldilineales bacterium]|nr:HEPN domain-containing protein [Caldilineales bacterium]